MLGVGGGSGESLDRVSAMQPFTDTLTTLK